MSRLGRLGAAAAAIAIVAGAIASASTVPAAAAPAKDPGAVTDFGSCLAGSRTGDVLLLIDESGSLQQTDPQAARVTAAQYLVNRLGQDVANDHVNLSVSVAAFASSYRQVVGWTKLTTSSARGVASSLNQLKNDDHGFETDYWTALNSSREALEKRAGDGNRCQAVVWFTDGELAISPRYTSAQQKTYGLTKPYSGGLKLTSNTAASTAQHDARADLCRRGGLADAIRADKIWTFAVGLQGPGPKPDFSLLKAIATGSAPDGTTCGAITHPSPGSFQLASNIDSLLFDFETVAGLGRAETHTTGICQRTACNADQHAFVLDASIRRVHILGTSTIGNAQVTLRTPSSGVLKLVNHGLGTKSTLAAGGVHIVYSWDSDKTVEVGLTEPTSGHGWTGQWAMVFTDPAGNSPNGVSRSDIQISSDITATWSAADSTRLRSGEKVNGVQLGLVRSGNKPVPASSLLGKVSLSAQLISPQSTRTVVSGLTQSTLNQPVTLDLDGIPPGTATLRLTLKITTEPAKVGNGKIIPGTALAPAVTDVPLTIIPPLSYPKVTHPLEFGTVTGPAHVIGNLAISGPGCVWFDAGGTQLLTEPAGIGRVSITSTDTNRASCHPLAAGRNATIPIQLSTPHQGRGEIKGTATVYLAPAGSSGKPITFSVPFSAEMRPAFNSWHFAIALVIAILLGLGLPILLLYVAKWFEARIPAGTLFAEHFPITVTPEDVIRDGVPLSMRDRDFVDNVVAVQRSTRRISVVGAITLRAALTVVPGTPCDVVVEAGTRVSGSSVPGRDWDHKLRARLPLAVQNHWVLLYDPAHRPDSAELLVLVGPDTSPAQRAQLFDDARGRIPGMLSRLRGELADRGLSEAAMPEPAAAGVGFPRAAESPSGGFPDGPGFPDSTGFLGTGFAGDAGSSHGAATSDPAGAAETPPRGSGFPDSAGFPDDPGFPEGPGFPDSPR